MATILLDSSEKRTLKEQATLTTRSFSPTPSARSGDVRQNGSAPEAEDAENGGVDADNASADAENIDPDK